MNRRWVILFVLISIGLMLVACDSKTESAPMLINPPAEQTSNVAQNASQEFEPWSDDNTGQTEWADSTQRTEHLIIKNGDMSLLVEDIDTALDAITAIAAQYGGYVLRTSANRTRVDTAMITIAVESESFEIAIQDIRAAGTKVLSESTSGEDVTAEYVDLDSRLRNLEATRDRLRGFLDEAQNVEEALSVNTELSRIEGEIEQVKGRMNFLTGRAAFSTITITLNERSPETPKSNKGSSLRKTLDGAIEAQQDAVRFLANLLIWLVVFAGPYLLIAGVIAWGVWRWQRRPNRT